MKLEEVRGLVDCLERVNARLFSETDGYEKVLFEWQIQAIESLIRDARRQISLSGEDRE